MAPRRWAPLWGKDTIEQKKAKRARWQRGVRGGDAACGEAGLEEAGGLHGGEREEEREGEDEGGDGGSQYFGSHRGGSAEF